MEVDSLTYRTEDFDEVENIKGLKLNMELLDEVWDKAIEKIDKYISVRELG